MFALRRYALPRRLQVLGLVVVGLVFAPSASVAALPPGCSQSGQTVRCTYRSGSNPFTVPAGVSSIRVVAVGGTGGSSPTGGGVGGAGAVVTGDLPVVGGSTLYAIVGGNGRAPTLPEDITGAAGGSNGGGRGATPFVCLSDPGLCAASAPALFSFYGGGGGGPSDVRSSQNDLSGRLLVAAGGGGSGGAGGGPGGSTSPGGAGGAGGGNDGVSGETCGGGPGLGGGGAAGGMGGAAASDCNFISAAGSGAGGSGGLGGDGGVGGGGGHSAGVFLGGGGGGGGGGLFGGGGGGGGVSAGGGGGGGGSNLVPAGGSQSIDTTSVPMVQIAYQLVPASKAQCKRGGWRNYPQFKNQGQCVAFVVTQARQSCLAERAKIGLVAFRNKYGLGRYHVLAMRRCVNRASR